MKILFLTTRIPYPPNQGDKIRTFNILKVMSSTHDVDLLTFSDGSDDDFSELEKYCNVHTVRLSSFRSKMSALSVILGKKSLQVAYYKSDEFKRKLRELLSNNDYDAVYIHLFRLLDYIEEITPYKIVDLTDAVSKEYERSIKYRNGLDKLIYKIETPRIKRAEEKMMDQADLCWAISEADKENLLKINDGANIDVIPNGISRKMFFPLNKTYNPYRIIFVGHMSVAHNIKAVHYFSHHIFPLVRKEIPEAEFYIVGKEPTPEVQRLNSLENVYVKGFVEDLNQTLNESVALIAPLLFSAGVQNKILEAMAAKVPVVTSKLGNEGLGAIENKEILVAETEQKFAQQLIILMRNKDYREEIATGGYQFVLRNFKWENILWKLSDLEKARKTKTI